MTARMVLKPEDRLEIADRIAQMSDPVLSIQNNDSGYLSLKVGTGPYSNAVTVWKNEDRVSFFIRSTDILNKASAAGFTPIAVDPTATASNNKYKYAFELLSFTDLQNNEGLFREIVKDSVETVVDRRPRRNSR